VVLLGSKSACHIYYKNLQTRCWWLMSKILAAEIRRIGVPGQPGQKVHDTPSQLKKAVCCGNGRKLKRGGL
jgi:hypothetical protein